MMGFDMFIPAQKEYMRKLLHRALTFSCVRASKHSFNNRLIYSYRLRAHTQSHTHTHKYIRTYFYTHVLNEIDEITT